MSDFQDATARTVNDAVTWAGESTRVWFDTCVRLVDGAANRTGTADTLARDLSALTAAGARDMARAVTTWVALGYAMLNLDLVDPKAPTDGSVGTEGNGDSGGSGGTG